MAIEKDVVTRIVDHGERLARLETLESGGAPHHTLLLQTTPATAAILARIKLLPGSGYTYHIASWALGADVSGDIDIDLWLDSDSNYPPTAADIIGTISLSSADHGSGNASGFSTDEIPHGYWLFIYCDTFATIGAITVVLELV